MKKKIFSVILGIIVIGAVLIINQLCLSENKVNTVISTGLHIFPDGITVKKDEVLIIEPGAHLKMGEAARILVKGKIIAKGTKRNPIIFSGNNGYWRGIKIEGRNGPLNIDRYKGLFRADKFEHSDFISLVTDGNIFLYCEFKNLASEHKKRSIHNRKKGVIESKNSSLIVSYCKFDKDIFHIGCILPIKSLALISHNYISSKMIMKGVFARESVIIVHHNLIAPKRYEYQTWPDGLVSDDGMAIIYDNKFDGPADDAIDCGNSLCFISKNNINRPWDDGIDIDNMSEAYIIGNIISEPYDEGILISDQSFAVLVDNKISGVKNENITNALPINTANAALTLRSGARVYCKNLRIADSQRGIYLKQELPLILSRQDFDSIEQAILELPEQEILLTAIHFSKRELINILNNCYKNYQGVKVLDINGENRDKGFVFLIKPLKKIFKLAGHKKIQGSIDVEQIAETLDKQTKEKLARYTNFLYIENSIIKNTETPFVKENPYYLKIKNGQLEQDNLDLEEDMTQRLSVNEAAKFTPAVKRINKEFDKINKNNIYIENLIQKIDNYDF